MLENFWEKFLWLIGGSQVNEVIPIWQLIFRTIIVYLVSLLLIRIAKRRFMGGFTTFDVLLGFVVGSILSRTITGGIRLIDMIAIVSVLIGLHWILATLSYYFNSAGELIKETKRELIKDGKIQKEAMRRSKIGENDLLSALRREANLENPEQVKSAYLERDGTITVIPKHCEAHLLEVKTQDGVQKIKISVNH